MKTEQKYTVYTIAANVPDRLEEYDNKHQAISEAIEELCKGGKEKTLQTKMDGYGNYIFMSELGVKFVEIAD
jgi:hypothetical protein